MSDTSPIQNSHCSIYEQAMGFENFSKLHPKIRERFGFNSNDRCALIGRGVMEKIWHGPLYTLPFLYLGTWRKIMFPEKGCGIPFKIENYAYIDRFGRETVTWVRTFNARKTRRFDATMIYSNQRNRIVDYLGDHQHLAVDLEFSVSEVRGIKIRSGEQRFYEGPLAFRFPGIFTGFANVHEWFDEKKGQFGIEVDVRNRIWGKLFGYRGYFNVERLNDIDPEDIPSHVRPLREEIRE